MDDSAKIGDNVNIGPFTYIGANSVIGDNVTIFSSTIMNNVLVDKASIIFRARVLENVKIKNVMQFKRSYWE